MKTSERVLLVIVILLVFFLGVEIGSVRFRQVNPQEKPPKKTDITISVELAKETTVLRPSYMTAKELDSFVEGTKLFGIGKYLIQAEDETGIGADILLAIICHETGKGTGYWVNPPYYNLFSWGVYKDKDGVVRCHISFDSFKQCIVGGYRKSVWVEGVPSRIKRLYLLKSGAYYSGETLYAIGTHYAADGSWYLGVERWLAKIPKTENQLAKEWAVGSKIFKPFDKAKGISEPYDYWTRGLSKEDFARILYRLNNR